MMNLPVVATRSYGENGHLFGHFLAETIICMKHATLFCMFIKPAFAYYTYKHVAICVCSNDKLQLWGSVDTMNFCANCESSVRNRASGNSRKSCRLCFSRIVGRQCVVGQQCIHIHIVAGKQWGV